MWLAYAMIHGLSSSLRNNAHHYRFFKQMLCLEQLWQSKNKRAKTQDHTHTLIHLTACASDWNAGKGEETFCCSSAFHIDNRIFYNIHHGTKNHTWYISSIHCAPTVGNTVCNPLNILIWGGQFTASKKVIKKISTKVSLR